MPLVGSIGCARSPAYTIGQRAEANGAWDVDGRREVQLALSVPSDKVWVAVIELVAKHRFWKAEQVDTARDRRALGRKVNRRRRWRWRD